MNNILSLLQNSLSLSMTIGANSPSTLQGGAAVPGLRTGASAEKASKQVSFDERMDAWEMHFSYAASRAHKVIENHFNHTPISCMFRNADGNTQNADMTPEFRTVIERYWEQFKIDAVHHIMVEGVIVFTVVLTQSGFRVPVMLKPESYDIHLIYSELTEGYSMFATRRPDIYNNKVLESTQIHELGYEYMEHVRADFGTQLPKDNTQIDPMVTVLGGFGYDPIVDKNGAVRVNSIVSRYMDTVTDFIQQKQYQMDFIENCLRPPVLATTEPLGQEAIDDILKNRYVDSADTYQMDQMIARTLERMGAEQSYQTHLLRKMKQGNLRSLDGTAVDDVTSCYMQTFWGPLLGPLLDTNNILPLPAGMTVTQLKPQSPGIDVNALLDHVEEVISEAYGIPTAVFKQNNSSRQGNTQLLSSQKVESINNWCEVITKLLTDVHMKISGYANHATQLMSIYELCWRPMAQEVMREKILELTVDDIGEGGGGGDGSPEQLALEYTDPRKSQEEKEELRRLKEKAPAEIQAPVQNPVEFGRVDKNYRGPPPAKRIKRGFEPQRTITSTRPKQKKSPIFDITSNQVPSAILPSLKYKETLRLLRKSQKLYAKQQRELARELANRDSRPDVGYGYYWKTRNAEEGDRDGDADANVDDAMEFDEDGWVKGSREDLMLELARNPKLKSSTLFVKNSTKKRLREFVEDEIDEGTLFQLTPAQQLAELTKVAIATEIKQFVTLAPEHAQWARTMLGRVVDDAEKFLNIQLVVRQAVHIERDPEMLHEDAMRGEISLNEYINIKRTINGQNPDNMSSEERRETVEFLKEEQKICRQLMLERYKAEIDMLQHPAKYAEMGIKPAAGKAGGSSSGGGGSKSSGGSSSSSSSSS